MANHGYVKSVKTIKPDEVSALLAELNSRLFNDNLQIGYSPKNCESKPFWLVRYISPVDQQEYASRSMWLETSRTFEMRHGGGSNFSWWIDSAICNAIALKYNATITDDGCDGKWKGEIGKYNKLEDYLELLHGHVKDQNLKNQLLVLDYEICPPEFRPV